MNFSKIKNYAPYLTHKSFDKTTVEGRHKERYRLAILASLANLFSTGMSVFALLIIVPITLPYLGDERFGVWMTISSIAIFLSFLDFGIGNGLINRVAHANTSGDRTELSFVVTHGLLVLTIIGGGLALVTLPIINIIPWDMVIKVKNPENADEIRSALLTFLLIFAFSIPLNAIQKIFQGMQISWQAHLIRGLGSIISLAVVWVLAKQNADIPQLLIATYGIQTAILLVPLIALARKKILRFESLRHPNLMAETTVLLRNGGLFFLLQIAGLLVWSVDSLIIASTLGAASVTQFALVQRIFQIVLLSLAIFNSPLWGAYADAHSRGDKLFISKTLRKSLVGTVIVALIGTISISAMSQYIFKLWIDSAIDIHSILVWSYGALVFLMAVGNSLAMFLNGVGEIRSQVITVGFFCAIALPLKYLGIEFFGIPGLILSSMMAYIIAVLLPYLTIYKERIKGYYRV